MQPEQFPSSGANSKFSCDTNAVPTEHFYPVALCVTGALEVLVRTGGPTIARLADIGSVQTAPAVAAHYKCLSRTLARVLERLQTGHKSARYEFREM